MRKIVALGVVMLLAGCGADVKPAPPSTSADIQKRTLDRIRALEDAVAKDAVRVADVQALITSLNYLRGHMEKEKVGTEEQLQALGAYIQHLREGSGGPVLPPSDWKPDQKEAPPEPKLDTAPLKELLPKLREVVESIK